MIDIISSPQGRDMGVLNTQLSKAGNVLAVQLGELEYEPDFGIDLKYFLTEDFKFQNESFRAYLVERLANFGINVDSMLEVIENLYEQLTITISSEETGTNLIAR